MSTNGYDEVELINIHADIQTSPQNGDAHKDGLLSPTSPASNTSIGEEAAVPRTVDGKSASALHLPCCLVGRNSRREERNAWSFFQFYVNTYHDFTTDFTAISVDFLFTVLVVVH